MVVYGVNYCVMAKQTLTLEARVERLEAAVFGRDQKTKRSVETTTSDFSGPTGGVRFLVSKGFFGKKKTFAEVRTALADNDYHYSAQAVQMALNRLAGGRGPLVSLKQDGKKVYAKRK
jgi:hypothetical protein